MLYDDKLAMAKKLKIESATFLKILDHLRKNPDVQNIDMMNLANFCRNCISKWYMSEAEKLGKKLTYDEARELVYGMPYSEYKEKYQKEATKEQLDKFNEKNRKK
tara:strand:+ start:3426 stop:3740 length:315 start_codon:yes stop_codon:yes gene_type:complete